MSQEEQGQNFNLLTLLLVVIGITIVTTVFRIHFFVVIFLLMAALGIGGIFWVFSQIKNRKTVPKYKDALSKKISKSISTCDRQITLNQNEIESIKKDIDELNAHLIPGHEINEQSRIESNRIIDGFEKQLDLRKTKIDFYEICKQKLATILYNHQLTIELKRKQQKLEDLEADQYDAVAQMETIKTELEYDKTYLQSIEELSTRMVGSSSLGDARELNLELVQITKELKRL